MAAESTSDKMLKALKTYIPKLTPEQCVEVLERVRAMARGHNVLRQEDFVNL